MTAHTDTVERSRIRCLTVRLPWATALFGTPYGRKDIENRTWPTPTRGPIGIHAAQKLEREHIPLDVLAEAERLAGHVLGLVQVVGCHKQDSPDCRALGCRSNPWAQFSDDTRHPMFHWEIEHPRRFVTPIRAKGALQLWEAGPTLAAQIEGSDIQL